jgi:flagellar motility protein MotE (MotC chaperone)
MKENRLRLPASGILFVVCAVLATRLVLTTSNLFFQPRESSPLFEVKEVLAVEAKKASASTPPKDRAEKPTADRELQGAPLVAGGAASELAAHLAQRENELKRKEQLLLDKEQHLEKMQQEVEAKFQEVLALQREIQAFRLEKAESRSANLRSLAQIYGSMKPKEAAKLLDNMEEKLVVTVISTMKANEAAEILASMDSKKAAKISEALTKR